MCKSYTIDVYIQILILICGTLVQLVCEVGLNLVRNIKNQTLRGLSLFD